jgi:hypothetical protein
MGGTVCGSNQTTPVISAHHTHSYAHNVLTAFVEKHGFETTKHYHLETAWRASFSHGEGGRTIGVNSEVGISTSLYAPRNSLHFSDGRVTRHRPCVWS